MICLKEYKSIIITLSVIALIAAGVVNYVKDLLGQPPESAPEHLQVKAPVEKILHSQKIKDEQGNDIVKYLYASETEVPAKTIKIDEREIKEDISKRTKNAQFFKKAVNKDNNQNADTQNGSTAPVAAGDNGAVAANESEKEVWVGRFYAGEPFYKDAGNNKWYQTETATTTAEEFSKQTKPNFLAGIKAFFKKNALADTESYYAGAGDGHVYDSGGSWAIAHDDTSGDGVKLGSSVGEFSCGVWDYTAYSLGYYVYRAFIPINTSGIGSDAIITEATLNVKSKAKEGDAANDGNDFITIVKTYQVNTSTLVVGDYEDCGGDIDEVARAKYTPIIEGVDANERKDITNMAEYAWQTWTLNAVGKGWINKTGWTKLGLREGHDVLNIAPSGLKTEFEFYALSYVPYLEVIYTVPSAPAKFRFDGGQMKIKGKVKFE